jgi:hypothetical protein
MAHLYKRRVQGDLVQFPASCHGDANPVGGVRHHFWRFFIISFNLGEIDRIVINLFNGIDHPNVELVQKCGAVIPMMAPLADAVTKRDVASVVSFLDQLSAAYSIPKCWDDEIVRRAMDSGLYQLCSTIAHADRIIEAFNKVIDGDTSIFTRLPITKRIPVMIAVSHLKSLKERAYKERLSNV